MSTATAPTRLLTPDDVLEMPNGKYCELVDGQVVEKSMGFRSQWIGTLLARLLGNYCGPNGLAYVVSECGYVCFPSKPSQMRRPDVSCILAARLPLEQQDDGFLKIRPDIAVEVISPNDRVLDLEEKLDDYRDAAILLVWLIYPDLNRVRVIRLDGPPINLGLDDTLTGEPILPGFQCRVAELFSQAVA
jgi:Uma2 family endonuclease